MLSLWGTRAGSPPPSKYARDYTTLHIGKDTRIGLRRLTDCTSLNLIQEVLCVLSLLAEIFFVIHVTGIEISRSEGQRSRSCCHAAVYEIIRKPSKKYFLVCYNTILLIGFKGPLLLSSNI